MYISLQYRPVVPLSHVTVLRSLSDKRSKSDQYNNLLEIVKRDIDVEYVFVVMKGLMILENVLRLFVQKEIVKLHENIMIEWNERIKEWELLSEEKLFEIWQPIAKKYTRRREGRESQQRVNLTNSCLKSIYKKPAELAKAYIFMKIKSQEERLKKKGNEDQSYDFDSMDIVALVQIMMNCELFQKFPIEMLCEISNVRNQTHHATMQKGVKFNNDDKLHAFEAIQKMMELTLSSDTELLEETKNVHGYDPKNELLNVKNLDAATITSALCQDVVFMEDRIEDLEELTEEHEKRLTKQESELLNSIEPDGKPAISNAAVNDNVMQSDNISCKSTTHDIANVSQPESEKNDDSSENAVLNENVSIDSVNTINEDYESNYEANLFSQTISAEVNILHTTQSSITEQSCVRRKSNLIIYRMPKNNFSYLQKFFEDLTGSPPPPFRNYCRIGKAIVGKIRPLLVRFHSVKDCQNILRFARNLRYMQDEYPRVGIAPFRTRKEQLLYRQKVRRAIM